MLNQKRNILMNRALAINFIPNLRIIAKKMPNSKQFLLFI